MTNEPNQFRAGDTTSWTKSSSDYPATDGWTLKYRLSGPSNIDFTAATAGVNYLVTVTAAASKLYVPGTYQFVGWVERGADATYEKHTVSSGTVEILDNLTILSEVIEGRSHVQIVVDQIEAAIEKITKDPFAEATILGRGRRNYTLAELMQMRSVYLYYLKQEQTRQMIDNGVHVPRLLVRTGATS